MKFRMWAIAMCAVTVTVGSQVALAQPGGGRGGPGGGGGGGGFGGGITQLLQDEKVKAELNIVPDQEKELQEVAGKIRDRMGDAFRNFRDLSDDERRAKFEEFRVSSQKDVEAVLLPQQRERLKQLMVQSQMRFSGNTGGINDTLATELGISEAQKEELRKKAREVQTELDKKIAKLRAEAQTEVLTVLTGDQRAKLEKMIGPKIEFSAPQFGGGGPGGGGPGGGGPGGGGPGGGRGGRGGSAPLQRPADGD